MTKVFVSGCFHVLHAGHVWLFEQARALGDHLTVSFASDYTLMLLKRREPVIPEEHRRKLIESLRMVDEVVMGSGRLPAYGPVFDFGPEFERIRPQVLAVTDDDYMANGGKALYVKKFDCRLVVIPKNRALTLSTTAILHRAQGVL